MKSITVLMFCWFLFTANLIGKKPTQEMYQSKIICGIVQTDVNLEEFEELFKGKSSNTISYEIYDDQEIILDVNTVDNLSKKIVNSRFKFTFLKEGNSTGLICGGGIMDGNEVTAVEIRRYFLGGIESRKSLENQKKYKQEYKIRLDSTVGKYKGHFIDGDDTDEKVEFEVLLNYKEHFDDYKLTGKIFYDDSEFEIEWQNYNNEFKIEYSEFILRSSKKTKYEFKINGKIENKVISGNAKIKKEKYIFITTTKYDKKGTIYLTKVD